MKSLFISKNEGEISRYLPDLQSLGFSVRCTSFLEFSPIYSPVQNPFEVIFFSSPRSVIFYLSQHPVPKGTLLACAGAQTAEILSSMGYTPDFIGVKSGNMRTVAEALKTWCGKRKILLPVSDRTLGTVTRQFDTSQIENLTTYASKLRGIELPLHSHYVFTSPSNFEGFQLKNSLPDNSVIISWGRTTQKALEKYGIKVNATLEEGSMNELLEILKGFA